MANLTKEMVLHLVEEEDVEFVRLQFTDIYGNLKNIAVTASQIEKALDNQCSIDGSLVKGFNMGEEMDLYLYPDPDTFIILPWRPMQGKVARMICDVRTVDGKPYSLCPRAVLKQQLQRLNDAGYRIKIGVQCEFFLFPTDEEGKPTTISNERASCYDPGPLDTAENARRDMVLTLEDMGFEVESSYHEYESGQHEIDFHWAEGLQSADSFVTFKFAVRTIAKRHGLHATFMPKPKTGVSGSGLHLKFALYDKEGKNVFCDPEAADQLSAEAHSFIGGLLSHMDSICGIANPIVNSYKRLIPGSKAPIRKGWSNKSKGSLILVPAARGDATTVELRSPDPSANPYLLLAVCIAAGLKGIENKLEPSTPIDNVGSSELEKKGIALKALPAALIHALIAMEQDPLMEEVLGKTLLDKYLDCKKEEWDEYILQVSQWEIDKYLYRI